MRGIVLNAPQVFVHRSFRGAPVDAVPGVFGRDVVSKIPVLVYFLTTPMILLAATASMPTIHSAIAAAGITYQASGSSEKASTIAIFSPMAMPLPTISPIPLTIVFSTRK